MTIGTISPFLFALNNRKSCLKRHLKNIILLNIDLCACVCARVRVCVLMNNKAIIRIKSILLKGHNWFYYNVPFSILIFFFFYDVNVV